MMKSVSILSVNDQLAGKSFSLLPLVQVGDGIARQGLVWCCKMLCLCGAGKVLDLGLQM